MMLLSGQDQASSPSRGMPPHNDHYWSDLLEQYVQFLEGIGLDSMEVEDLTDDESSHISEIGDFAIEEYVDMDLESDGGGDDIMPVGYLRESDTESEWSTDDDSDLPSLEDFIN